MSAGRRHIASENKPASELKQIINRKRKFDSIATSSPSKMVETPCFHYIEFQTKILKLLEKITEFDLSSKLAFQELSEVKNFFKPIDENKFQVWVNWPVHNGNKDILVVLSLNDKYEDVETCALHFYDQQHFLSMFLYKDQLIVERPHNRNLKNWEENDIQELVTNFNEILRVKKINYKYKNEFESCITSESKDQKIFSKHELNNLINKYNFRNITYKIQNVILKNSSKDDNNTYTFKLNWLDNQNVIHPLKICFSRTDEFYRPIRSHSGYSWFITENVLLNHFSEYNTYHIKPGQYYYSLTVYEACPEEAKSDDEDVMILKLWLSLDALYGELHGVHKGRELSGNEVINIYKFFDELFRIKNTFICDESKLTNEDETIRIPIRLISALSTGKTWYEEKLPGVRLFECKQFKTAHEGVITQNSITRSKALNELQNLPIKKWYEMLDATKKNILYQLFLHHFDTDEYSFRKSTKINHSEATLKELTTKIYTASKKEKKITSDLINLTKLLCEGLGINSEEEVPVDEKVADGWVKIRVKELLWNSYFWVKQPVEEKSREFPNKYIRLRSI